MKHKLIAGAVAGLFSLPLFAQEMTKTASGTTFGLRAGVNFQNITGKDAAGNDVDNGITTGFNAGLNAEIPIGSGTYIQPGVLYSMKGAEAKNTDNKVKLSYVEIPVNFLYKPILGTGNMLLGFGPYVGFGIGGTQEINNVERDVEFVSDYEPANPAPQFNRVDAGANFLAGYEFANNLSFQLNAQLGLVNINPEIAGDKSKLKNTGFGLSLGYRF